MKFLLLSIGLFISVLLNATTFTSVMDGNWSNPYTWGETTVIPLTGDQVIINHTVTITDQITSNGYWATDGADASITIEANGILQSGANVLGIAILNGASIVNNGQLNIPQLGNYNGSFTNNNISHLSQLIYNLDQIENNGDLLELDSLYTSGTFINNNGANIYTDSLWVEGSFTNIGNIYLHEITNNGTFENIGVMNFRRFTNLADYYNSGSIIGELDATNAGNLYLNSESSFTLGHDFTNADSTDHNATIIIEGTFDISDSFYNADTITGTDGHINIQNNSSNSGWLKGTFYFCDLSPLPLTAPFVDYNSGTVEAGVRYCTSENIAVKQNKQINFFPNPVKSNLTIENANKITLTDITGKIVLKQSISQKSSINISHLKKGIYFISLENKQKSIVRKIVIE